MQIINTGTTYRVYDSSVRTFDVLPSGFYQVDFSPTSGFYLTKIHDLEIPNKIYGCHKSKVEKTLQTFERFERNLGVILSGPKGIGKSLFARMLTVEAVKREYPVIIVKEHIDGIANFIESIEQKICVLFDEFDKTFKEESKQTEMLSLFDGLSVGKKLFVITCNELNRLSEYLVNRPGRFHYHFRFDYLSPAEITEYMMDNIPENKYDQIDDVIVFSRKVQLNYDCLRAIAFEIAAGYTFREAIRDLNIVRIENTLYNITVIFNDDTMCSDTDIVDLFDDKEVGLSFRDNDDNYFDIEFDPRDSYFNPYQNALVIDAKNVKFNWDSCNGKKLPTKKIAYVKFSPITGKPLHYSV